MAGSTSSSSIGRTGVRTVYLRDENGELFSVLTGWTDAARVDPFVVVADGRCPFTTADLIALAELIDRLRSQPGRDRVVREITP
jgi:hypothetical protein